MFRRAMRTLAALSFVACSGANAQAISYVTLKGKTFYVELAENDEQHATGLMFREHMAADRGMLFIFRNEYMQAFWMKNTLIPLDMIFVRADGTIDRIAENTIPELLEPVVSGGEVSAVLELAGGTAAKLGIDESARVTWKDKK